MQEEARRRKKVHIWSETCIHIFKSFFWKKEKITFVCCLLTERWKKAFYISVKEKSEKRISDLKNKQNTSVLLFYNKCPEEQGWVTDRGSYTRQMTGPSQSHTEHTQTHTSCEERSSFFIHVVLCFSYKHAVGFVSERTHLSCSSSSSLLTLQDFFPGSSVTLIIAEFPNWSPRTRCCGRLCKTTGCQRKCVHMRVCVKNGWGGG